MARGLKLLLSLQKQLDLSLQQTQLVVLLEEELVSVRWYYSTCLITALHTGESGKTGGRYRVCCWMGVVREGRVIRFWESRVSAGEGRSRRKSKCVGRRVVAGGEDGRGIKGRRTWFIGGPWRRSMVMGCRGGRISK